MKAVDFVDPTKESLNKKRDAAQKIADAKKVATELLASEL